jgi:hypothetical protein
MIFDSEDEGYKFLRNVGSHIDYMMIYLKNGNIYKYSCEHPKPYT